MRKKKGVNRNLQKNPNMSEIWKSLHLSLKKRGGALLWLVDLAAAVSFDTPSEAVQWWALSCLLNWYRSSSCCHFYSSMGLFVLCWQLLISSTSFTEQGEGWLILIFKCTHNDDTVLYTFESFQLIQFYS
jgi:hypothetical protein